MLLWDSHYVGSENGLSYTLLVIAARGAAAQWKVGTVLAVRLTTSATSANGRSIPIRHV